MHSPQQPHFASSGGTQLGPISATAQTALLEAAFCKPKLCSGNQPQPQCLFAQESNACLVLTQPCAPHRPKEGQGCLWTRGPRCLAGGLCGMKQTPNMLSFREKADWAGKGLVCTGPSNLPFAISGGTQLGPNSDTAHTAFQEAAYWELKLCSGNQPQPQCVFAQESSACVFLP